MRNLPWLHISALMGVFLGGLILTFYGPNKPIIQENYAIEEMAPREDSMDYHLIMADLAWQRQLWSQAAVHYAALAQNTQEAEFALLATSAALEAQLLPLARQNAQLWATIEPNNSKAQALTAALYLAEYNEESAFTYLSHLMDFTPDEALPHLLTISTSLHDVKEQNMFFSLLQRLSSVYEHQPSIWFVLARQAQSLEYNSLALQATEQALALQPNWVSAIALKVQLLYQTGQKIKARDYLAVVTKRMPHETDLQFIYTQIDNEITAGAF